MKTRIGKQEEKSEVRMREFEAAQEKLDMGFFAKQEKMAEQWNKLLQEEMSNKLLLSKSERNNTVTRLTSSAAPAVHDNYGPERLVSYFMDDAYYSGLECHQAEKKHQLAVNMDDTNFVRLNFEKQSRKRSGSSQNFLLPSSFKRNQLWLGG